MAEPAMTTAWMWRSDDGLRGLDLDVDEEMMTWYELVGCHCYDQDGIAQDLSAFRREGPPPYIGSLPADVAAEVEAALATLS